MTVTRLDDDQVHRIHEGLCFIGRALEVQGGKVRIYVFEGHSDDTFGEYGQTNDDYDNCASGEPIRYRLATPDGAGIVVTGMHCYPGQVGAGWMIGVETLYEDMPVDWPTTMRPSYEGYRNQLTVEAPDDAELVCLNRKPGRERDA